LRHQLAGGDNVQEQDSFRALKMLENAARKASRQSDTHFVGLRIYQEATTRKFGIPETRDKSFVFRYLLPILRLA
jgi:hypothetical protein